MNIVFINTLYEPIVRGGAEIVVKYLAEGMVRRGHSVTVITLCDNHTSTKSEETISGVKIYRLVMSNVYWCFSEEKKGKILKIIWHLRDAWNANAFSKCHNIIQSIKPDILHTNMITGFSPSIWSIAKVNNIPLVHTEHSCHLLCPRSTLLRKNGDICLTPHYPCKIYRQWYENLSKKIDVFCTPSKFLMDLHLDSGFLPKSHQIVNNGIPQRNPTIEYPGISDKNQKTIRFIYIGRLEFAKGVQVLLDAFRKLCSNSLVELHIAGTGELEGVVNEACNSDSRIKYHGFVSGKEKQDFFKYASALIFPSISYETFGIGIVEAYCAGIPVIASRIGALPELIHENESGYLFESGSSSSLTAVLSKIIAHPEYLYKMKRKCLTIAEQYSVDSMVDKYTNIYSRCIEIA